MSSPRLTRPRRVALFKALADARRLELVDRIARSAEPLRCMDACAEMKISPATASHHLKELESSGLVRIERAGKFGYLSLDADALESLAAHLLELAQRVRG